METKDLTNETDLPEKGASEVENTSTNESSEIEKSEEKVDTNSEEKVEDVVVETSQPEEKEIIEEVVAEEKPVIEEKAEQGVVETTSEESEKVEEETIPEAPESEVKEEAEPVVVKKLGALSKEDYSVLSKQEMLVKLNELVRNYEARVARDHVEDIKVNFYKMLKAEAAEARKKFEEEGGNLEEFSFQDSTEDTFKVLYNLYREKRHAESQRQEETKKDNLKAKYKIIDDIKELINNEESINKTFQDFRDLQNAWRDAGLVPQSELKALWESYNHTVESFYDFIKINKELRDLDLKKNLEEKIILCEKAEALILEEAITKAFKTLQEYHNHWREIGPVPREQKDDIWERFKAATSQINRKHQEYFEGLKDQQIQNLEQKTALCDQVEAILNEDVEKPKGWEEKADKIIEIQKLWRTIGFAPKKDNNKIYQRFKVGCDEFFSRKRDFYKKTKDVQKNNLQLKLDLCVQAEALKDNQEWKKTTEDFIKLQKRWKEIGPVPKKHSESLWKRFRTACDSFFHTKSEFFSTIDSRQEDNLKFKQELIEKVKAFEKTDDDKESLKMLMELQKEWSDIGHVPLKQKEEISKEFRDAINDQFEKLNVEENERNRLNFKNKVDNWVSSNSKGKMYSERNKLVIKIKELENEIALYENNIGFFSNSKNANSMIEDINRKIEKAKERMTVLKQKLRMLDNADIDE